MQEYMKKTKLDESTTDAITKKVQVSMYICTAVWVCSYKCVQHVINISTKYEMYETLSMCVGVF